MTLPRGRGYRTSILSFDGLADETRPCLDWLLSQCPPASAGLLLGRRHVKWEDS